MASPYRSAITKFAKRHGPTGDTKYDIFDNSGMSRGQLRRGRTTRRKYVPPEPGVVSKVHPRRIV